MNVETYEIEQLKKRIKTLEKYKDTIVSNTQHIEREKQLIEVLRKEVNAFMEQIAKLKKKSESFQKTVLDLYDKHHKELAELKYKDIKELKNCIDDIYKELEKFREKIYDYDGEIE